MNRLPLLAVFLYMANWAWAQPMTRVREIFSNDKEIGQVAFIQADINHDGQMDILADANDQQNFFIGTIQGNDLVTLAMSPIFSINHDLLDVRYEDSDQDGHMEIYALVADVGLIQFDTLTLAPLDTFDAFDYSYGFRKMLLQDLDTDGINEWIVLDQNDGMDVYDIQTHLIKQQYPSLKGRNMIFANFDLDPDLELALQTSSALQIIDWATGSQEKIISNSLIEEISAYDMNIDGIPDLLITDNTHLYLYSHITQTFVSTYTTLPLSSFEFITPYNLDSDDSLEIIAFSNNSFIELNTYPFSKTNEYVAPTNIEYTRFLGQTFTLPNELVFYSEFIPYGFAGLGFFNPVSRIANRLYSNSYPNGLTLSTINLDSIEYLVCHPAETANFFNIKSLVTFSTLKEIDSKNLYDGPNASLEPNIFTYARKGLNTNFLVTSNSNALNFYNTKTQLSRSIYNLNPKRVMTEDIDFDGQKELLIQNTQATLVYRDTGDFEFKQDPIFESVPHSYPFKFQQLDSTRSKELVSYFRKDVWIYNGTTGALENTFIGLTDGDIIDIASYTNGNGDFFLVLISSQKVYVYNFTKGIVKKTFNYSASNGEGRLNIFQMQVGDSLLTRICTFKTELKVFTPDGMQLFESSYEPSTYNAPGQILMTDFDHDLKPNIITSSHFKFTEYEYTDAGTYHQPFYLTDLFPANYATLRKITPFQFQFSEGVDPVELSNKLLVQSKRFGVLDFTIKETGDHQLEITPLVAGSQPDTITIQLRGSLLSKLRNNWTPIMTM